MEPSGGVYTAQKRSVEGSMVAETIEKARRLREEGALSPSDLEARLRPD